MFGTYLALHNSREEGIDMKKLISFVIFLIIPLIFTGCGDVFKKIKGGNPINLTLADAPSTSDILVEYQGTNANGNKVPMIKAVTVIDFDANKADPTIDAADKFIFIGRVPQKNSTSSISSALGLGSLNLNIVSSELYLQPFRLRYKVKAYPVGYTVPTGLTKTDIRVFLPRNGFLAFNPTDQQVISNGLTSLCEFYSQTQLGVTILGWDLCDKYPQIQQGNGKYAVGLIYWTTPEDRSLNRHL